ncbi:MAG: ParB/RepB/Spo0J family partition protein [Parcubacteria group bacterium]
MLGKGLESLIPSGGYKNGEENKSGPVLGREVPAPAVQESRTPSSMPQPILPDYGYKTSSFPVEVSETKPAIREELSSAQGYEKTSQNEPEADYSRGQASVFQIEVEKIFPNPHQPRKHFDEESLGELASSIREFGIIQPLVVTKVLKETENGTEVTYQLIAGERRLMAAKKVGLRTVPAVIKQVGLDRERLELAIIENVQRENLNPLEAARSFARLQDEFGLTQREIAARIGKSRETIANTLRLLNLPSEIQQALDEGKINESHARLLLQIEDISRQREMFQSILRSRPSVRELKATIRRAKTNPASYSASRLNPELMSLQTRLEEHLGTKVEIDDEGNRGKITINYYSPEELNALIDRLSGEDF